MSNQYIYEFQTYYRRTGYGGRDEAYVYRIENNELIEIKPALSRRSRSGRHGFDIWRLERGTYIVVYVSRSNNVNKPYEVLIKKLHITDKPEWIDLLKEEIMNLNELPQIIEKAKEIVMRNG
jgi:hypothetical protein